MTQEPDYVLKNREHWDGQADQWVAMGERAWSSSEVSWGMWGVPEAELRLLPIDMTGMHAIELGCGTAYIASYLIRLGATVVGIDNSQRQLDTARRLADEHGVELELIHGNAEVVPKPDESFDFAVSEYGAAIWADPYKWVPEAHRLLKQGGELVMLGTHPLTHCVQDWNVGDPLTFTLMEPYFGMHRVDWKDGDEEGTEFNLTISDWFKLWKDVGFDVVAYHELQAPTGGDEVRFFTTAEWAHRYPSEQIWKVRKRS